MNVLNNLTRLRLQSRLGGGITYNLTVLSPQRDCSPKMGQDSN